MRTALTIRRNWRDVRSASTVGRAPRRLARRSSMTSYTAPTTVCQKRYSAISSNGRHIFTFRITQTRPIFSHAASNWLQFTHSSQVTIVYVVVSQPVDDIMWCCASSYMLDAEWQEYWRSVDCLTICCGVHMNYPVMGCSLMCGLNFFNHLAELLVRDLASNIFWSFVL